MLQPGHTIEYVKDVAFPASQAGRAGDTKVIGRDISLFHARYLMRGERARLYDPDNPYTPPEEETADGVEIEY